MVSHEVVAPQVVRLCPHVVLHAQVVILAQQAQEFHQRREARHLLLFSTRERKEYQPYRRRQHTRNKLIHFFFRYPPGENKATMLKVNIKLKLNTFKTYTNMFTTSCTNLMENSDIFGSRYGVYRGVTAARHDARSPLRQISESLPLTYIIGCIRLTFKLLRGQEQGTATL